MAHMRTPGSRLCAPILEGDIDRTALSAVLQAKGNGLYDRVTAAVRQKTETFVTSAAVDFQSRPISLPHDWDHDLPASGTSPMRYAEAKERKAL